jgi:anti-sigma B factor antagonist
MQLTTSDKGPYTLVSIAGRLDATTAQAFDAEAKALESGPPKDVIVDLSGLEYLSSSGLRSFLSLAKSARKAGRKAAFCSLTPMAREAFRIAGFMSIMEVTPDERSAAEAFASR